MHRRRQRLDDRGENLVPVARPECGRNRDRRDSAPVTGGGRLFLYRLERRLVRVQPGQVTESPPKLAKFFQIGTEVVLKERVNARLTTLVGPALIDHHYEQFVKLL